MRKANVPLILFFAGIFVFLASVGHPVEYTPLYDRIVIRTGPGYDFGEVGDMARGERARSVESRGEWVFLEERGWAPLKLLRAAPAGPFFIPPAPYEAGAEAPDDWRARLSRVEDYWKERLETATRSMESDLVYLRSALRACEAGCDERIMLQVDEERRESEKLLSRFLLESRKEKEEAIIRTREEERAACAERVARLRDSWSAVTEEERERTPVETGTERELARLRDELTRVRNLAEQERQLALKRLEERMRRDQEIEILKIIETAETEFRSFYEKKIEEERKFCEERLRDCKQEPEAGDLQQVEKGEKEEKGGIEESSGEGDSE